MTAGAKHRRAANGRRPMIQLGPRRRRQILSLLAFYWQLRRKEYRWLWDEALSIVMCATLVLLVALGLNLVGD